jgi:hypothetical protein
VPTETPKVDWEQIKRCLAVVDRTSKDFLRQALLIDGAACLFYRNQLYRANDPDFQLSAASPEEENRWVSRDIDFTGIFSQDALLLLPNLVVNLNGRKFIRVEGVRFGFAQVGVTFDPLEAMENAWVASFTVEAKKVEFLVIDPLTWYFEKARLCQPRGAANDYLHRQLLLDYVACELVRRAERLLHNPELPIVESRTSLTWWHKANHKTPEILQDPRVLKRLSPELRNHPNHPLGQMLARAQAT